MDAGIALLEEGLAPYLVVSGNRSFMQEPDGHVEAQGMRTYALNRNVPEDKILTEEESLDTIGNAYFTKRNLAVPRDWNTLTVVTSESHAPRAEEIFRHVYGPRYTIVAETAPEEGRGIKEKVYEVVGSLMMDEVLRGTDPGDDAAIRDRLFGLVPGYDPQSSATKMGLARASLLGAVRYLSRSLAHTQTGGYGSASRL
jgi:hypothetical protein